jgi:NMD protein affecting ribosome stability and mRNA decay
MSCQKKEGRDRSFCFSCGAPIENPRYSLCTDCYLLRMEALGLKLKTLTERNTR